MGSGKGVDTMQIFELIQGLIGFGLDLVSFVFRLFLAAIVSMVMSFKNRSGLLWGALTFFFPWAFFLVFWVPKKMPRLDAKVRQREEFKGLNPVIASIMALSAMIAKSDGRITEKEILLVKQFVARNFRLGREELDRYKGAFEYGKQHPEDYLAFADVVRAYYSNRMTLLGLGFLFIGLSHNEDGAVQGDDGLLRNILLALGISQMEYQGMKNSYYARSGGHGWQGQWQQSYGGYQGNANRMPREDLKKRYSEVLGVSLDATAQEIKSAYRKIVKEFHPDMVASKGMPEEYIEYATNKVKEANEAYEYLMKQKGA